MRYYIIAGEASGDLHGSNLMRGIYEKDPKAIIRFWGGDLMNGVFVEHQKCVPQDKEQQVGISTETRPSTVPFGTQEGGLVRHYKEGAVMGFTEVLAKAGKLLGNLRRCKQDILGFAPDCVILIDYPGFNFKIAEFAHKHGLKVFY